MKQLPKKITRAALLELPERKWDEESIYNHIFLVPTGKRHESGWGLIAIVGVVYRDKEQWAEIAAVCDDVCWSFPLHHPYDRAGKHRMPLRTDCLYPAGIMRFWGSSEHYFKGQFKVGFSLSSTDVELMVQVKEKTP